MNKTLFAIIGETCAGKDSLINELCKDERFSTVISYTDRPMRIGEKDGREHWFITENEFTKLYNENQNKIMAYTKISKNNTDGYRYMALTDELEKHNIYIIDPKGFYYLKEKFPELNIKSILIKAPIEDRINRSRKNRSNDLTEFLKRVKNEEEQFKEFEKNGNPNLVIHNTNGYFNISKNKLIDFCNENL